MAGTAAGSWWGEEMSAVYQRDRIRGIAAYKHPLAGDVTICLSSIYTAAVIISACPLSSTTIHNADSVPSPHPDGPAAVGQVHSMGDALVPYQRLSAQYPPSTSAVPVSGIEHPSLIRVSHRRWCLLPPCGSSCWVCSVWLLFRSFL